MRLFIAATLSVTIMALILNQSEPLLTTVLGPGWSWSRISWLAKTKAGAHVDLPPDIVGQSAAVVVTPGDPISTDGITSQTGLFIWPERKLEKLAPTELAAIAKQVDFVLRDTRDGNVRTILKANNPQIRLIGYLNAIWMWKYDDHMWRWSEVSQRPDWFLKDVRGSRIQSNCCGNPYNMDPGNVAWQDYLAEAAMRGLGDGLDGIYLDDVQEMVPSFYYKDSWPISPRTGKPYTDEEWKSNTLDLVRRVYSRIRDSYPDPADKLVFYNGVVLNPGQGSPFIDLADGIMFEGFIHPYWQSSREIRPEWQWKEEVDALISFQQRGKMVFVISGAADGNQEAMNMFTYTSYLLGKGPTSLYDYSGFDSTSPRWPGFSVPIGTALGDYYRDNGIYHRDFTGANIVVNPSASQRLVNLSTSYYRLNNNGSVSHDQIDSVVLPPHSGAILLPADTYSSEPK